MNVDSQTLESYVPVYDVMPERWEDARGVIAEQLKKITNSLNVKDIGYYLDEEILSGKSFIPGQNIITNEGTSQQFRSILRKVIQFPGLVVGINSQPHGIIVTSDFSLIELYASATNSTTLTGTAIPNGTDTITYDATNINIMVSATYDRAWAVIEYIQEL